jgi:hypothetical protein
VYENLILPLVIILFLLFILVVPSVLYRAIRKIADPVSVWMPVLLAGVVLLVMAGILRFNLIARDNTLAGTLVIFSLILFLTSLGIITPYLWFGKKTGIDRPWLIFSCLSFFGVASMFYTTMGHSYEGQPLSPFGQLLPLTGWILDSLAALFNLQEIVYSALLPVHTILLAFGLYLQILIIATVYFGLLSLRAFRG